MKDCSTTIFSEGEVYIFIRIASAGFVLGRSMFVHLVVQLFVIPTEVASLKVKAYLVSDPNNVSLVILS